MGERGTVPLLCALASLRNAIPAAASQQEAWLIPGCVRGESRLNRRPLDWSFELNLSSCMDLSNVQRPIGAFEYCGDRAPHRSDPGWRRLRGLRIRQRRNVQSPE